DKFFFFQAEDGIRDFHVTGVQTCALPIYGDRGRRSPDRAIRSAMLGRGVSPACSSDRSRYLSISLSMVSSSGSLAASAAARSKRSEERRVGKEGRCRRWEEG